MTLAALVSEHLQSESSRSAAARTGGLLTHSTLIRVANGNTKTITRQTAQGLAIVLDMPLAEVYAAYEAERLCLSCEALVRRLLKL